MTYINIKDCEIATKVKHKQFMESNRSFVAQKCFQVQGWKTTRNVMVFNIVEVIYPTITYTNLTEKNKTKNTQKNPKLKPKQNENTVSSNCSRQNF